MEYIAPREVRLAATRRVVGARHGLGGALPEEVDRNGGIDRHEVRLLGDHPRVVDVANRPQLERRVLVEELVELACPQGEGANSFGAVQLFGDASDHAAFDEIHHTVGDQLGVDAEVLVIGEPAHDRVRVDPIPTWIVAPFGIRSAT